MGGVTDRALFKQYLAGEGRDVRVMFFCGARDDRQAVAPPPASPKKTHDSVVEPMPESYLLSRLGVNDDDGYK